MKNTFGTAVCVTLFGESHAREIGAVLDGLAAGIPVSEDAIRHALSLRRPDGVYATSRVEKDDFRIISGVYNGYTTGAPLTLLIPNTDAHSGDYAQTRFLPRPSHADYAAFVKYHGFEDPRGGGHFSGRLTSPLVACGAIAREALARRGIAVGTHIRQLHGVSDRAFGDLASDIALLWDKPFAVLDDGAESAMKAEIQKAAADGDSVGGILETAVTGLPAGVGEPWFDTVEGVLSHALFSIPAVKGVAFGDGFGFASLYGSEANDAFCVENGRVVTTTNRCGGILGGITSGMPVIFTTAFKPTPSIYKPQQTVDLQSGENAALTIRGRHDPAIVARARVVVDCVTALALCDLLTQRFGTDYLGGHGA